MSDKMESKMENKMTKLDTNVVRQLTELNGLVNDLVFDKALLSTCESVPFVRFLNPADSFDSQVKKDDYDVLSDEAYAEMVAVVDEERAAFQKAFGDCSSCFVNYVSTLYNLRKSLLDVHKQVSNLLRVQEFTQAVAALEEERTTLLKPYDFALKESVFHSLV